jgi:hypothetical protein
MNNACRSTGNSVFSLREYTLPFQNIAVQSRRGASASSVNPAFLFEYLKIPANRNF